MSGEIDVVIAWVDGDDPNHRRKREAFLTNKSEEQREDVAGATRFSAQGEIEFCVLSILKYAQFVRKIFIVTDNQTPDLEDVVSSNFPDNKTPIEIVDHKVIFREYEEYLPSFNSLSIETMLWRIPELSEKFVYFNDDVMLLSPIAETDWFEGSAPIYYGRNFPLWLAKIVRALKPRKGGERVLGHKDPMIVAAEMLGADHFGYFVHAPIAQLRSSHERFYAMNKEALISNIKERFRAESQYNPQVLCHLTEEIERENCVRRSPSGTTLFMKPEARRAEYMKRKLRWADKNPNLKFGCISSLDKASKEQVEQFRSWFEARLGVTLS